MEITVKLYAMYRAYLSEDGPPQTVLQCETGAAVTDIVRQLGLPVDEPRQIFVNGRISRESARLSHGDVVGIFPYISGG